MKFVDLLRNFVKQAQWQTPNEVGDDLNFNDKKLVDISDSVLRSPSKSLPKLAQAKHIGLATAYTAVREKSNLFPYKVTKPVQTDARGHNFQHLI
jgi:hypothetical protein